MVVVRAVGVLCLALLLVPLSAGVEPTFTRRYEVAAMHAYGDPATTGDHHTAYVCHGGRDTAFDTGACFDYLLPEDYRGLPFTVTVDDTVFGRDTWAFVTVDVNGDNRIDCGADSCFSGYGVISGQVPLNAVGGYVRVHPATVYSSGLGCCPVAFGTNGVVTIVYHNGA